MQEKKSELDKAIYRLYSYYKVYTDTALSKKMNVSRSAISQWRYKGVIPKKILSKYDQIISGVRSNAVGIQEQVVVENQPIHITKGEEPVDASYIIDLQKDKIESQKREIARLSVIVNQQKETKDKPAFHFKTKSLFDIETKTFGRNKVSGDISMTGYTREYLCNLEVEEWSKMFHPESLKVLAKSIPDEIPDHTHNRWKHILWRSKNNIYRVYNIESYFEKQEGVARSYYYWVNGDIEGQS